jgi:hypothetical protein
MARSRVQVRDLEEPERIQPAPVQSDTYARPAAPPINNDLERLSSALSQFGATMTAVGAKQKAEAEKALKDAQLAEYERWKAATSSDDQLVALRAGKVPLSSDPIIHEVFRKDHAVLEAQKLSSEIDADFQSGAVNLAGQDFDVDKYVREKAAPYMARMAGDDRRTIYFGQALDKVRESAIRERDRVRGIVQTQAIESKGYDTIVGALQSGIDQGASPQAIMDTLRNTVYKEIGPRLKRGSLDLSYGRLDELTMDAIEALARKPETAGYAVKLLDAQRRGLDPAAPDIGALRKNRRFENQVARIETIALKTRGDAAEVGTKDKIVAEALTRFGRGDGSFNAIGDIDIQNPADPSRRIKMSAKDIQDTAVQAYIAEVRKSTGGKFVFEAEMPRLMANGVLHPEFKNTFEQVHRGVLNLNLSNPGEAAPQLARIQEFATLYSQMADANPAYARDMAKGDTGKFFELYRTLTRYGGRTPEVAAQEVASAFAVTGKATADPKTFAGHLEDARRHVRNLDFSVLPGKGEIVNRDEAMRILMPLAEGIAMVESVDAKEALTRAAKELQTRGAYINGRLVFHPGINPGDEEFVQPILDRVFEEHKDYLKSKGVAKSTYLSLQPAAGTGKFVIVKWDGGTISLPTDKDDKGKPIGFMPRFISEADIQNMKAKGADYKAAAARKLMREQLERDGMGAGFRGIPTADVPMDAWKPKY